MKAITTGFFIALTILIVTISCSKNKTETPEIIGRISELSEFKKAESRIDSLKRNGIKVQIQISIIQDSIYPEDSLKNISIAFIEEDYGFDQTTLYEIKFNKTTEEIISIESPKKGFDKSNGPN
jgi:hypothetical protein